MLRFCFVREHDEWLLMIDDVWFEVLLVKFCVGCRFFVELWDVGFLDWICAEFTLYRVCFDVLVFEYVVILGCVCVLVIYEVDCLLWIVLCL